MKSIVCLGIGIMFAGAVGFGFAGLVVLQTVVDKLKRLER